MRTVKLPVAIFVVAVLAVIGIGVGLVGGLPTESPGTTPASTYTLGGVRFTIRFPAKLERRQDVINGVPLPLLHDVGTASHDQLGVDVIVIPPNTASIAYTTGSPCGGKRPFGVTLPPLQQGEYCVSGTLRNGYEVIAWVGSGVGTGIAEAVMNSVKVLKTK